MFTVSGISSESVQKQIRKRGIKTVTGLGRHYRSIDRSGTGILDQHDLERGLLRFHIDLLPEVVLLHNSWNLKILYSNQRDFCMIFLHIFFS